MTVARERTCGECGEENTRIWRVEAGVSYCGRCYARCFKRALCPGCGMFRRLLKAKANARCRTCVAAAPCVRCRRPGLPVHLMTSDGPVCGGCRPYFRNDEPCDACGALSRELRRVDTDLGEKRMCAKCAPSDHRSCAQCRRHRACTVGLDGKWRCALCTSKGKVPCPSCGASMPAGRGRRCEACYWLARTRALEAQLIELMEGRLARQAFTEFADWMRRTVDIKRAAHRLRAHAEFFAALDRLDEAAWSGPALLARFGPAGLRRFELPVRWLTECRGVRLDAKHKQASADTLRVASIVAEVPANTPAHNVISGFARELTSRVEAEKLQIRSMRMALRPAVDLLAVTDSGWQRMPSAHDLKRYLSRSPGQRAALSPFLRYLRQHHAVTLAPAAVVPDGRARQDQLERRIASMAMRPELTGEEQKLWYRLCLELFHGLNARAASRTASQAIAVELADGYSLKVDDLEYWLPKPRSA